MEETFASFRSWTLDDNGLTYKNKLIPYSELSLLRLLTTPTMITNGVIQTNHKDKLITLSYGWSDRVRAVKAVDEANKKINEAHGIKAEYKYRLSAHTGTSLEVYDTYLVINFMSTGSGFTNIARGGGTGNKKIKFTDLTSLTYKEPAGMTVGFIQFAYPGSVEVRGGISAAINDENSIPIQPSMAAEAAEIVEYIERRRDELRQNNNATVVQQASSADELLKFKQLLDAGVITQEEFEFKKKQLLGL